MAETGALAAGVSARVGARAQSIDRLRVMVAAAVVCMHATIGPASPLFTSIPPEERMASNLFRAAVAGFSVNSFLVIAFLLLHRSVSNGAGYGELLGKRLRRVVPGFLFWSAAYVGLRAVGTGVVPSADQIDDLLILGAADHLYYVPLLLALTATYPVLLFASRWPVVALLGAFGISAAMHTWGGAIAGDNPSLILVVGAAGVLPFPLLGLVVARAWGGPIPPARYRVWIVAAGAALVVAATLVIARGMAREAELGTPLPRDLLWWGCEVLRGAALSIAVLAVAARDSRLVTFVGPLTYGIYLVHPIFIIGLRLIEARLVGGTTYALLILPNALVAFLGSATLVYALQRTPMRRLVSSS